MEATQQQQQHQQQQSMLDRKIRELNETLKEYIGEAREGAKMGNYESSQVFYEGVMREIEKLVALTKSSSNHASADVQRKDALLASLKKLELELEAVKSLAAALEPIRNSFTHTATNGQLNRPSSALQYEPMELPVKLIKCKRFKY